MITEKTDGKTKKVIIEYDTNKYTLRKTTSIMGGIIITLNRKYWRCACCDNKVTKENYGGHILKKQYRDKKYSVIWREDQKDFVCNKCLRPDIRHTMETLGLSNRK